MTFYPIIFTLKTTVLITNSSFIRPETQPVSISYPSKSHQLAVSRPYFNLDISTASSAHLQLIAALTA